MTSDPSNMSCEEFQAQLPELIGSGEDASAHPHLKNCDLCRALLAESRNHRRRGPRVISQCGTAGRGLGNIESAIKQEESGNERYRLALARAISETMGGAGRFASYFGAFCR